MKTVIKNKLYDTETATRAGMYDDFSFHKECYFYNVSLYVKDNGEWFLCGRGNGISDFYDVESAYRKCGEDHIIYPITGEEARVWSETYLDADKYMELFGEVEE